MLSRESIKNYKYFLEFKAKFEKPLEGPIPEKIRTKKSRWTVPLSQFFLGLPLLIESEQVWSRPNHSSFILQNFPIFQEYSSFRWTKYVWLG